MADLHPSRRHVTGSHEETFLFQHQFSGVCIRSICLSGRPADRSPSLDWTSGRKPDSTGPAGPRQYHWCSAVGGSQAEDKVDPVGVDTLRCCGRRWDRRRGSFFGSRQLWAVLGVFRVKLTDGHFLSDVLCPASPPTRLRVSSASHLHLEAPQLHQKQKHCGWRRMDQSEGSTGTEAACSE